ncbi:C1 family peptidase [Nostocaceae cyanobacterium CENA369]|uniref:C1 family peptidase n=1 Tax=Dendronalium phyllosphericum CENA369 TaxID=1725256 RepID=A0A8J7LGF7_9NOST|nr:C1 family peptidase [Dendronalium phyllosphericum]MBH8572949.1 C1 family peptidase [Dendronalium phyllosphericum CENA369]
MESKDRNQQSNNARKKGLGWIPDYPDLRDYNLDNQDAIKSKLRFKREERTGNFDTAIEELINIVSDLVKHDNCKQNRIDKIKNNIFGNVLFAKVRVHKFLREITEDKDTNNKEIFNYIKYESILSKQILELRKYLGILLIGGYIQGENSSFEDFSVTDNVVEWMNWMGQEKYDLKTQSLVKDFQRRSCIMDDGIVGLETYTTFNEYFSQPDTLEKLKYYIEPKQNSIRPRALSKIKFFSVNSLIPSKEFEKLVNVLILKSREQISKEFSDKKNFPTRIVLEKIFEYSFLKKIEVEETLFQKILDLTDNYEDISTIENNLLRILDSVNEKDSSFCISNNNIIAILINSYVIDPIFSVVTRILYPLAKWRNKTWKEIIEHGFEEFEKVANQDDFSNNRNIEPEYSETELVRDAILQVLSLIKQEIYSIESEKQKDKNHILVYFLLKKYLNRFEKYISNAETEIAQAVAENKEVKSNIFDKQEVFEIELLFNYRNSSNNNEQKKAGLFPTLDLHIPIVTNNYINELTISKQPNQPNKKLFFLLPGVIDLSFWCSPVRDQGSLNSCTAFAAIALLEYFENRNFGKTTDASPLFLYQTARNKMNVQGDVGVSIRETMKALALFGVPPEESWPYDEDNVNEEPPPYCYAYAQNYKTLKYFLLDYAGITTESLLFQVKAVLAAGFPCIFGLTLYSSVYEETNVKKGYIPYPDPNKDKVVGGHTAVVVGYDDYKFIRCADRQHYSKGAFLVRNSWGSEWGENGYGWLPYDYVLAGLTAAWWSLLKAEWFDESNFGQSASGGGNNQDQKGNGSGGENQDQSDQLKKKQSR